MDMHDSAGVCSEPVFRFFDSRDISAVSDSGSHKMYDRIYLVKKGIWIENLVGAGESMRRDQ